MILNIQNLSKSYIVDPILESVNMIVEDRDKIGLIGNNGSGKTTLLKIISGEISKDEGDIVIPKDIKIGYLRQEHDFEEGLTIYGACEKEFNNLIKMDSELKNLEHRLSDPDNSNLESDIERYGHLQEKFMELGGFSYPSMIRGTLIGLGFSEEDFERNVNTLSGGQKSRVGLAKLLLSKPDLMLLDEPTNHLDVDAISWLEKYLKDYLGACIIISHDRYFLNNVVNKIVLLENHSLTTFVGNYDVYVKERKKQIEQLTKQYENQQKEIKRQEQIIERYMGLGRDRFIRQGKSRQKLLDKMKRVTPPNETKKTKLTFTPLYESGKDVLQVRDLAKSFPNKKIFENITFNIYKNEKCGIIGDNGVGKSTLFKILTEELEKTSGVIQYGSKLKIAYFDQEMEHLNPDNTVIDEIWDEYPKLNHYEIRSYLAKFLFIGDDVFKIIGDLSGGEKGRVSILKLMLKGANTLFLDEPTNHLDIDSKEVFEEAIRSFEGTVISISHDRYFLNSTCDKILKMNPDGMDEFLGNYDYYLQKTKGDDDADEVVVSKTQLQNQKKQEKQQRDEQKKLRIQKEKLEKEIELFESQINEIDTELSNPEIYSDIEKVQELSNKRQELSDSLSTIYDEWIELEDM